MSSNNTIARIDRDELIRSGIHKVHVINDKFKFFATNESLTT